MATLKDQLAALEREFATLDPDVNPRYREALRGRIANLQRASTFSGALLPSARSIGETAGGLAGRIRPGPFGPRRSPQRADMPPAPEQPPPLLMDRPEAPATQPAARGRALAPATEQEVAAGPLGLMEPAQRLDETTGAGLRPTADDLAKADMSPEVAALREAIRAPQPVFRGLAFNKGEQAALGLIAGLRGIQAVQPIIEQRRRDAVLTYEAAREARAERIREASALVGLQREERQARRQESERAQDVGFRERSFQQGRREFQQSEERLRRGQDIQAGLARDRAAAKARGRPATGQQTKQIGDLQRVWAALTDAKRAVLEANPPGASFEEADVPGAPGMLGFAATKRQAKFKASFERTLTRLRRELIGAAQTNRELVNTAGFLPSYGDRDVTVRNGLQSVEADLKAAYLGMLRSMGDFGYDTGNAEARALQLGIAGPEDFGIAAGGESLGTAPPVPEDWIQDNMEYEEYP